MFFNFFLPVWVVLGFVCIYFKHIAVNSEEPVFNITLLMFQDEIPILKNVFVLDFLIAVVSPVVWLLYISRLLGKFFKRSK